MFLEAGERSDLNEVTEPVVCGGCSEPLGASTARPAGHYVGADQC